MALRKAPKADLRREYPLWVQVGALGSLAILLIAFTVNFDTDNDFEIVETEFEVVQVEEIEQTQQIEKPPPPPKPPVPIEVPNEEVLEDVELDLDIEMDMDEAPPPPPPPPAAEPEPEAPPEPEIFTIVENPPEMLPNQADGMANLQRCIKYPEMAKRAGIEGRVFVQFVVNEQGNVTSPQIARGIGGGADEEALRCVSEVRFKPGRQRGRPVKVKFSLPVTFRLR